MENAAYEEEPFEFDKISPVSSSDGLKLQMITDERGKASDENATAAKVSSIMAVEARDVEFNYDRNISALWADPFHWPKPNPPVLQKISITAPKGKIYALLGSSGCGKTTLLKCILGRIQPKSGTIRVFGRTPGSKHCPVPGPGVGYMPQELALYPEFTIRETLRYFGQLYRMSPEAIKSQTRYVINLLHLPENNRLVKQLSGGQQRRVSLASALFHQPPLMILDEPTVGVDPLLRAAIWNHLEKLCRVDGLTVIITTHYIEEARAAETIGLMRYGRLLAQSNPEDLLAHHNLPRLEDVFLKLCVLQDNQKVKERKSSEIADANDSNTNNNNCDKEEMELADIEIGNSEHTNVDRQNTAKMDTKSDPSFYDQSSSFFDPYRFNALFTKNSIRLRRNFGVTLFYCLIPAIQFALFVFSSGTTPRNLPVAVYNEEQPADLTAKFLSFLDPKGVQLLEQSSLEDAEAVVRQGKAWAALHFHSNFSSALDERRIELANADNDTIEASNIHLMVDMSNQIVGFTVFMNIFLAFESLMKHFLGQLGYNPNTLSTPITITEVVYGNMNLTSMTELITPGVVILIAFFSTAAVTGLLLILERKDGLLERSLVAGVKPLECLLSHVMTQTMILIVQQILLFLTIFVMFNVPSRGPVGWIFLICFLQGIAGVMFGLLISSLCPDEVSAAIVTMGSLLPTIMLSGIFWPVQSVSAWLRYIALLLPQTLAMDSIRSVLSRGWTFEHEEVVLGYVSTTVWILVYMILAAFVFSKFI